MFEKLKRRRRTRAIKRARKVLGVKVVWGLEVLELHRTKSIILHSGGYIEWRGTWLLPRSITRHKRNDQVLEIRRVEETCKDFNVLVTYGELVGYSSEEAVAHIKSMGVFYTDCEWSEPKRGCMEVIIEWFRKEVE